MDGSGMDLLIALHFPEHLGFYKCSLPTPPAQNFALMSVCIATASSQLRSQVAAQAVPCITFSFVTACPAAAAQCVIFSLLQRLLLQPLGDYHMHANKTACHSKVTVQQGM